MTQGLAPETIAEVVAVRGGLTVVMAGRKMGYRELGTEKWEYTD